MGRGRHRGQHQGLWTPTRNRVFLWPLVEVRRTSILSTSQSVSPWQASGVNTSTAGLAVSVPVAPGITSFPFHWVFALKTQTLLFALCLQKGFANCSVKWKWQSRMFSLWEGTLSTQPIISIQLSKQGWHGGKVPGEGLHVVIIIYPGSAVAGEEPDRRDPGQICRVTGGAETWQGAPQLYGGSKGRCKEQVSSYLETFPHFKIKYFAIYSNFVLFYCVLRFSALQFHSSQCYWHCCISSRSVNQFKKAGSALKQLYWAILFSSAASYTAYWQLAAQTCYLWFYLSVAQNHSGCGAVELWASPMMQLVHFTHEVKPYLI